MNFENQFSLPERLLHRFAFRTTFSQLMLADFEEILFRDLLDSVEMKSPVFITGLPRAGTTILLQLLVESGGFASSTYRDMPYPLCPLLWSRIARSITVEREPRERAHGDGLYISTDSPEAFEEMAWKRFWPEHYASDRIRPWSESDSSDEFDSFFRGHMRRVIAVRQRETNRKLRYVSKNNVNIARITCGESAMTGGLLLIPFRDPLQHAFSLLRQHRRFLRLQEEDSFVLRYMEGIGHHDFGRGLRPIDFGGWFDPSMDSLSLDFWLQYWTAAYRAVLESLSPRVFLFSLEDLMRQPRDTLSMIAHHVKCDEDAIVSLSKKVRAPRPHHVPSDQLEWRRVQEAREVHSELVNASRACPPETATDATSE